MGESLRQSESQTPPRPTKPRGHTCDDQHVALAETQTLVLPHGLFSGGRQNKTADLLNFDGVDYYTYLVTVSPCVSVDLLKPDEVC